MAGRILVLEHQSDAGADALADHLLAAGAELVVVGVGAGEPVPALDGFDALVVLGGVMDVWEEDRHPWLVEEKVAIRAWIAGPPRPLLGICLGHQLLADALGGDVGLRSTAEAGIQPVHLTAAGTADPVLAGLGPSFTSLQWHGAEVRRVPDGAVVLATNARCAVQAMRVGEAAWGVQFHPEVSGAQAAAWGRDPVFRRLLEQSDGPGAADGYPARQAAASAAMAASTALLAAALAARLGLTPPPGAAAGSQGRHPPGP